LCQQAADAVYDKPMIYYPLSTLMMAGIRDILMITTAHDAPSFHRLLGDGSIFGINISCAVQDQPNGLAQAFVIGANHNGTNSVALVFADNIFYGPGLGTSLGRFQNISGGVIFAYWVANPSADGVLGFSPDGIALSIEEKPATPKSHYAVPSMTTTSSRSRDRRARRLAGNTRSPTSTFDSLLDARRLRAHHRAPPVLNCADDGDVMEIEPAITLAGDRFRRCLGDDINPSGDVLVKRRAAGRASTSCPVCIRTQIFSRRAPMGHGPC
jgi:NDP-sugar pyrophosphorylase family protein